jgi:hypothetical protein
MLRRRLTLIQLEAHPMAKYNAPKKRLHRDFVYLDHDTILNSLSAFEAGRVDEIIEKTSEATDKAADAGVRVGPLKGGVNRKREQQIQEELVRKRTWFSAFEAWYVKLDAEDSIGRFSEWDLEVRDALSIGDTIEFIARVRLSPLHLVFATFISYAKVAGPQSPMFQTTAAEAADARRTARMVEEWTRGPQGSQSSAVYFEPASSVTSPPRIVGRIAEPFLLRGLGELDGQFTIVAQVESMLGEQEQVSAIRVIRDAPPTPLETQVIADAMRSFSGPASEGVGVVVEDQDIMYRHPAVVIRPIAIYR